MHAACDPAIAIADWLQTGAPAGIECGYDCLDGIFPRVPPEEPDLESEALYTDYDAFINYSGVETDPDVQEAIKGYVRAGYLKPFDTLAAAAAFVGGQPIITKVGAVKKGQGGFKDQ